MERKPTTKEIVATMRTKFPLFSRIVLCMCRNPAYGCVLSDDAASTLHDIYPDYKIAQNRSSSVKRGTRKSVSKRKKSHHLTLRLDDESYAKFEAALKSASATSTQAFLEKVLEDYYGD